MAKQGFGKQFYGLLGQSSSFSSAFNVAQVCLTWFVFSYTHSAVAVGFVAIVETLAVIVVSLPVGSMMDRANKGAMLVVSGAMGAAVFMAMILMNTFLPFNLYTILALVAVWGLSREIARSSNLASLPDLVDHSMLSGANGLYRAVNSSLGSVSNALAGGIIIAFGVSTGFGFSAGAYLVSVIFAIVFVLPFTGTRKATERETKENRSSMLAGLKEVLMWLVKRKGFFLLTVSATFFNFFMDMTFAFYVIYVAEGLSASSLVYGIILSVFALGDVTGSLIPGRIDLLKHTGKINVVFFGGLVGASILALGLFPTIPAAIIFSFTWGLAIGIGVNLWLTSAHNIVPQGMRGRYFAFDGVLSSISPVAIAVGAFVISFTGILGDFIIAGILLLASTAGFALMKSLWKLDGRAQIEQAQ